MSIRYYPQLLRNRPRTVIGLAIGIVVAFLVPGHTSSLVRTLLGWDAAVWSYLLMIWVHMARAEEHRVREYAIRDDENAGVVLFAICLATVASIAAIVLELASAKGAGGASIVSHYLLTGLTLMGAWFLIPTIFTLHYARLYYDTDAQETALKFPDHHLLPNYWDRSTLARNSPSDARSIGPVVLLQRRRARLVREHCGGAAGLMTTCRCVKARSSDC